MAKNLIKVGDYYYDNRKAASTAENELKAVEYMRENLDLDKPEELFAAYEQMIAKKVFVTEVGMSFLEDIRNYLKVYATLATKLSPLYPIDNLAVKNVQRQKSHYKEDRRRELAVTKAEKAIDPRKAQKAAVEVLSGESAEKTKKKRQKKEKINEPKVKVKKQKEKVAEEKNTDPVDYRYRELFHLTLTLCIVLFVSIVAMFIISSTSNNINILNYENEIIDKYSTWEQELSDREKELDAWEKELSSQH